MNTKLKRALWSVTLAIASLSMTMTALPLSHFTRQSKLAQGHWVKIAVSQTGMYQITLDQLHQMGFTDPQRVQVYGYGGKMLSEVLTNDLPDDLQQVPALRLADKVCFYATGPIQLTLSSQPNAHYSRTLNTYSLKGYYFLTEATSGHLNVSTLAYSTAASPRVVNTSLAAVLHEQELMSVAYTGSELLGEDLMNPNHHIDFTLINPSDTRVGVTSRVAAKVVRTSATSKVNVSGNFNCQITVGNHTIDIPYKNSATNIAGCTGEYTYYQLNASADQNTTWFDLPDTCHAGSLHYGLTVNPNTNDAVSHLNRLDYFIVTYNQYNRLSGNQGAQCPMGFTSIGENDVISVDGNNLVVWDVTTPTLPCQLSTRAASGKTQFSPSATSQPRQYVAFDPSSSLLAIDGFEIVENQNLHGLSTPHMLIITHHEFLNQAERVAQMHRQHDGMDVLVLDQDKVFNEFSAGTPDAMAIRLLCKMLYDRDPAKFKYLLIFGNLSYDNRGITTGKHNRVLSYVASVSHNEDLSYLNNDFYGYLDDGSGQKITAERLRLGIGHMPVASSTEAAQAVDKLQQYVYSPDYGVWRNHYSLWAENSTFKQEGKLNIYDTRTTQDSQGRDSTYRVLVDSVFQLHESQAAGIGYIIDNDSHTQMVRDMAFVRMFPQSLVESFKDVSRRRSEEAKRHIQEMFSEGQYYTTYVGHAGSTALSATGIWTSNDVQATPYPHLPIMTTACCDVARFDSDHRGIAELMWHKRDGGAIALFTTTRQVLAIMNDDMNRTFTSAMFSYHDTGIMPRLGDAYVQAKNYYSTANVNKLHWVLLGDPALQVNYPKPLVRITAIGGISPTSGRTIGVHPMQRLTIDAQIMREADPQQVDTQFNGDATITVYDSERVCMPYIKGTGAHSRDTMSLSYPRERLMQVTGRVVNGIFHGSGVMPRYWRSGSGTMLLSVYAHQDGTHHMVNGLYAHLNKLSYSASHAIVDHTSPIIHAMYLNDQQQFAASATIGTQGTLYIRATDNTSFCTQQQSLGRSMRLTLDGGKQSYNLAKNLATVTDEGRSLAIAMPLTGLTPGRHTLTFTVSDISGNSATRSITFVVGSASDLQLQVGQLASSTPVTIGLDQSPISATVPVDLRITDLHGTLVWSAHAATLPLTWPLTDTQGRPVAPGLYRISGSYHTPQGYGGSRIINFVVLPHPH